MSGLAILKRYFVVVVLAAALLPAFARAVEQKVLVLGDSLSSGYGFDAERSWVALLADKLEREAYGYEVVNASISGDTTSGGLSRLPRLLDVHEPEVVVIELGGNDGLRGQPVSHIRGNIERMIELVRGAGAEPVLAGIEIPPNYGPAYTSMFRELYADLAEEHDVALVPFLLDGVALNPELMQGDGIHPTAEAQARVLDNVWRVLEDVL